MVQVEVAAIPNRWGGRGRTLVYLRGKGSGYRDVAMSRVVREEQTHWKSTELRVTKTLDGPTWVTFSSSNLAYMPSIEPDDECEHSWVHRPYVKWRNRIRCGKCGSTNAPEYMMRGLKR